MLGRHNSGRGVDHDWAAVGPQGHFVIAVRAEVGCLLEPTGHTRQASQADTQETAEDAGDTV